MGSDPSVPNSWVAELGTEGSDPFRYTILPTQTAGGTSCIVSLPCGGPPAFRLRRRYSSHLALSEPPILIPKRSTFNCRRRSSGLLQPVDLSRPSWPAIPPSRDFMSC